MLITRQHLWRAINWAWNNRILHLIFTVTLQQNSRLYTNSPRHKDVKKLLYHAGESWKCTPASCKSTAQQHTDVWLPANTWP